MNCKYNNSLGFKKFIIITYIMLSALLPLLICSKNSPLYPYNDWPDLHIFITMGKGLLKGRVPYADLLEHKGPYVFLMTAIGYLISNIGFIGYFLFECISIFFFLYYTSKIIKLYSQISHYWVLPLLCVGIVSSKSFAHGGSAEEFMLGFLAYSLYSILCFLTDKTNLPMHSRTIFFNGLWAGVILWSKFTVLGLYIAWMLILITIYFLRKQYHLLFKTIVIFLGGMIAATLPWLIYFGIHHAIDDWFTVYIWNNIFGYASGNTTIIQKFTIALQNTISSLGDINNRGYSLLAVFGCIGYVIMPLRYVSIKEKTAVFFMGFGLALGIYIGGTLQDYYVIPLAILAVFGLIVFFIILEKIIIHHELLYNKITLLVCGLTLIISLPIGYRFSSNSYLLSMKPQEMPQFRFAEQIKSSEDTSVLNYAFLDGGFYTILNQVPSFRIFCLINMQRDVLLDQQNEYIRQQLTNWVVSWNADPISEDELRQRPIVSDYYDLVDYQYFYFESGIRTYSLYKRKDF